MDAALFQRFHPEEYYRRFLADGVRPDGRVPQERRRARLQRSTFAKPRGSATVRLGESAVVAGVRAEVTEASPEQPAIGRIVATVELPPLCAQVFRERSKSQAAGTFLSSALTEILNSPHVLNTNLLNIREAESCWVIYVDVVVLNFDGNAFDLSLLAALAALEDTSLPALMVEKPADLAAAAVAEARAQPRLCVAPSDAPESVVVAEARGLKLLSRPLPVTFAQLPGERWVVDPCAAEEGLGATVSLCIVGGRWLVYHSGGSSTMDRFLSELMPVARSCVPALTALLDSVGENGEAADVPMG